MAHGLTTHSKREHAHGLNLRAAALCHVIRIKRPAPRGDELLPRHPTAQVVRRCARLRPERGVGEAPRPAEGRRDAARPCAALASSKALWQSPLDRRIKGI
eukprot:scaffold68935_cov75-Phaeocystis_antarctica.AAC.2